LENKQWEVNAPGSLLLKVLRLNTKTPPTLQAQWQTAINLNQFGMSRKSTKSSQQAKSVKWEY
jgi:hypothetical protein